MPETTLSFGFPIKGFGLGMVIKTRNIYIASKLEARVYHEFIVWIREIT
jgi:hypothetical protein